MGLPKYVVTLAEDERSQLGTLLNPPAGRVRWTLRRLADRVVQLGLTERCSYETIRRALKKLRQAVADAFVVHLRRRHRLRGAHGGRARPLCRAV